MKCRVILLGPPGSGKGTVAAQLQTNFGFVHISSGNWLRREIELGTAIGQRVKLFLEKGDLVPDQLVLEFMEQRLAAELSRPGFLLDGFPRTLGQAEALDQWLGSRKLPVQAVILFQCSETVILDRITGRRVCVNCARVYHMRNHAPRAAGRCDVCGGELIQREDDTERVLRRRLDLYTRQTEPLMAYYRAQGKLKEVDSSGLAETTYAAAVQALKE